ncbi:hypothetical protein QFZ27_004178 [Inquilinus ginsengisoli]|uniref:class I SAM-dependent methyltransferase n=1 Tax=Inquilinus ginsengisoli TaxID=363840 RepID=UPI003D1AC258
MARLRVVLWGTNYGATAALHMMPRFGIYTTTAFGPTSTSAYWYTLAASPSPVGSDRPRHLSYHCRIVRGELMAAELLSADGSKTKHRRSLGRAMRNWIGPMFSQWPRAQLRVTLYRFGLAAVRYAWFVLILRRLKTVAGEGVAASTVRHNLRGMLDLHVERSVRLIYPIVTTLLGDRQDPAEKKVLSIGPRTEGELFNLVAYGFRRRNIRALDLISYSPMVDLGDMHAMSYPDASFDIVLAGWVISYSDAKEQAAAEIARVAKPGAIVAIGVEWGRKTPEQVAAERAGYIVGSAKRLPTVDAILELFGDRVDRVYFRQDDQDISTNEVGDLLVVFRLK